MRKTMLAATTVALLGGSMFAVPAAHAAPSANGAPPEDPVASEAAQSDNMPNPLDEKRSALRETAVAQVLTGDLKTEKRGASTVAKVGEETVAATSPNARGAKGGTKTKDQYVELEREATDRIFVILAEFGDEQLDGIEPAEDAQRTEGPLHNEIPAPDRRVDNSTVWQADYDQTHYQDLYFGDDESLREYYETQSSGRYSVDGIVTDWVKVDYSQARYGTDSCGSNVCDTVWDLVKDAANVWYEDQLAQGRSEEEVNADLQSFDVWDRYDYDGDGDFNEPDGYIDHFQIVHAGGDQADGDPIYGSDAIWSHRWYAFANTIGLAGPSTNPLGGTEIGTSGVWIGDYTIQPENGGRSVFYHEYGHDLGLPDDYNVLSGGDNNNEHWTLMAQSRLNAKNDGGLGERGGDLGAWNKLQLGWLDYEYVTAGTTKKVELGPAEYNSKKPQSLIVGLPPKTVTVDLGAPASGDGQWYSGTGDDLTSTLTRDLTVPAEGAELTFQARYDIETGYDYFYVEVDSGSGYVPIEGSLTTTEDIFATDGTQADWTGASYDLTAFAGQDVSLRLRYMTDGGVAGNDPDVVDGIFLDDIAVEGVFSDDAESADNGWVADGFAIVGEESTEDYPHFYIAANRSYTSYDKYLETGPYFFGYGESKPDLVDHYAYQEGLLISYWDTSYSDNDTFAHPGSGRNLYIDAHPTPLKDVNGDLWRARVQVYDAPFGLTRTDGMTLHVDGVKSKIKGQAGNRVFDDTDQYWFEELPNHGVKLPATGTQIKVLKQKGTSMTVAVS